MDCVRLTPWQLSRLRPQNPSGLVKQDLSVNLALRGGVKATANARPGWDWHCLEKETNYLPCSGAHPPRFVTLPASSSPRCQPWAMLCRRGRSGSTRLSTTAIGSFAGVKAIASACSQQASRGLHLCAEGRPRSFHTHSWDAIDTGSAAARPAHAHCGVSWSGHPYR
jgi:hypothetical protein